MAAMGVLPILSMGMGLAGNVMQAYGQKKASEEEARVAVFDQQQYQRDAEITKTAAAQAEAQRNRELASSLQTIEAMRAGRGTQLGSPTGDAISADVITGAERDIRAEKLSYLLKSDNARLAADMAGRKAKYSLLAGKISAGATLLSGASRAFSTLAYPTSGRVGS